MKVEYIEHLGSDLTVINAARVSLAKHHDIFQDNDEKLISYLAKHDHWTPFSHPQIQLRITVPIFVANQLKRHTIGLTLNEESRRYIDTPPEFYITDKMGVRAENKKQGAKEGEFKDRVYWGRWDSVEEFLGYHNAICLDAYQHLLANDIAAEDARIVLPLSTYTSWYWTGSLYAYSRIYNLRIQKDAQRQTQEVAKMIADVIEPLYPYSWKALTND